MLLIFLVRCNSYVGLGQDTGACVGGSPLRTRLIGGVDPLKGVKGMRKGYTGFVTRLRGAGLNTEPRRGARLSACSQPLSGF